MSANSFEDQSAPAVEETEMDSPVEHGMPDVKSGVRLDKNAELQRARFFKNDIVHMSLVTNGQRSRGQYTILDRRYNGRGGYVEYQLIGTLTQQLFGSWVREKDLKIDKRG
ncbi:hypothetical protein ACN47E_004172 [Coniothyrium glycines]